MDLLHELRATLSDRKTQNLTFRELPKQYRVKREDFIYKINSPESVAEEGADKKSSKLSEEFEYDSDGGVII